MIFIGLFIILGVVLIAPFSVKRIEEELEIFLFCMGLVVVTITSQWSGHLIKEALLEPIKIALAVFAAGFLFMYFQKPLARNIDRMAHAFGLKVFAFLTIVVLGLLSSVITAIIAALVLVEIVRCLGLSKKNETVLTVVACFSIGFGAVLTPIGEPLSTIVTAKLRGWPYWAGFFFLLKHLWVYIIPGVLASGILGMILMPKKHREEECALKDPEDPKDILFRSGKVYLFVMALVFLGQGFKPIIDAYISKIPSWGLYWINSISAILDNATLAAAEIDQNMTMVQIKSALLGLLIAGVMLIPGNIPNIIAAGKLKIKSTEWAKVGVPLGLAVMVIYFLIMILCNV